MYRGTTPTNVFTSDLDLTEAEVIYITYKQGGETKIEKTADDITVTSEELRVTLTQDETLSLKEGAVDIQIRARFSDGTAVASNTVKTTAERILKDGVI